MILRILNKLRRVGPLSSAVAVVKYPFELRRRIAQENILKLDSPKDRFSEIYKRNIWSSSESGSGEGSEISYTENLRQWLITNINLFNIKTFVDAPCGDFNWMKLVLPKVDVDYIGLDIVDSVIEQNKAMHASDKIKFETANICDDKLPECDIIMVRDCLFHLSYEDINSFLVNLSKTNYKYLLTTTHKLERDFENKDIQTGDFRLIDLFKDPFFFDIDEVTARVDDFPEGYSVKREMILVEKPFVPAQLTRFNPNSREY